MNYSFARELYTEDQTLISFKSMKVLFATSVGLESDQGKYLYFLFQVYDESISISMYERRSSTV